MHARPVWVLALGLGLLALAGPGAGRAAAALSPLCIGPTGSFVKCGTPGSQVVTPPTTTPTTGTPSSTVPGSPTTVTPSTVPGSPSTVPSSSVPSSPTTGATVLGHPTRGGSSPSGPQGGTSGEHTDVIVGGSVAGIILLFDLVGLVAISPARTRRPLPHGMPGALQPRV